MGKLIPGIKLAIKISKWLLNTLENLYQHISDYNSFDIDKFYEEIKRFRKDFL